MKRLRNIAMLWLAAAAAVATGCSRPGMTDDPVVDPVRKQAVLRLHIRLETPSRAAGDELPANDGERMHSMRVIIADGDGYVEHNSFWDLDNPNTVTTSQDYKVKADDDKTILLVANERRTNVTVNGVTMPATAWLDSFDPVAGTWLDADAVRSITMQLKSNAAADGNLLTPLCMTGIYSYHIGTAPHYDADFGVTRAAAKYVFRFINDRKAPVKINKVEIDCVHSGQYLFPPQDADAYNVPADASSSATLSISPGQTLTSGRELELTPFYVPEGGRGKTYRIRLTIDDTRHNWQQVEYISGDRLIPMTDLPRNHGVIINVMFSQSQKVTLDYTVCPWGEHIIQLPGFN